MKLPHSQQPEQLSGQNFNYSMRTKDITGEKYGQLSVLKISDKRSGGSVVWECICSCGNTTLVSSGNLNSGHTTSCGCHKKKASSKCCTDLFTKHGHAKKNEKSATYYSWICMLNRCNNPKNKYYKNYGGRGVVVCKEWYDFTSFLADMGERPDGTTIDRIDVNGNYEPSNCRWATNREQHNNKRSNHKVNYKGEILTISQLASKYGINRSKLYHRINRIGLSVEESLAKM